MAPVRIDPAASSASQGCDAIDPAARDASALGIGIGIDTLRRIRIAIARTSIAQRIDRWQRHPNLASRRVFPAKSGCSARYSGIAKQVWRWAKSRFFVIDRFGYAGVPPHPQPLLRRTAAQVPHTHTGYRNRSPADSVGRGACQHETP